MVKRSYVLVSACRNEEGYIDRLIETIAAQTEPPLRWVIVDDGSTDGTSDRARVRSKDLPWLEIVKMPGGRPRSFASQVYAAQHGAEVVSSLDYEFIGFLDADIRVAPDYYERLMGFFAADPRLGLGGGVVIDQYPDRQENVRKGSEDYHVAGGVQFFRRECFQQVGGYVPIEGGGQDTIADVMALMRGWRIRSFPELPALHLRPDGFARDHTLARGMKWGRKFYLLGYHPVFYLGQCARRLGRAPVVVGSLCQALGYFVAMISGEPRPVPTEFVEFQRRMQVARMRKSLVAGWSRKP